MRKKVEIEFDIPDYITEEEITAEQIIKATKIINETPLKIKEPTPEYTLKDIFVNLKIKELKK